MDESILGALTPGIDMLFLCNPNNPTGILMPDGLLARIAAHCAKQGIWLVVDECFLSLTDDPEKHTARPLLAENPRLLILDAFTKLYGMAGVRLGYLLCADAKTLRRIDRAGQPWAVSSLAQAAGIAALGEEQYIRESRALIAREKPLLRCGLESLGLRVYGGEANYLFFRAEEPNLCDLLARNGISIRSCGNYANLDNTYYRIAVRTSKENRALLFALREIIRIR